MSGPEWAHYIQMTSGDSPPGPAELEVLSSAATFDVCVFEGDLVTSGSDGRDEPVARVVVRTNEWGTMRAAVAGKREDEVPIRFDLLR